MSTLYPLAFTEIVRNYGFGDRWITREFNKPGLPDNHRIAETWEVCDRPGESSVIRAGELTGATLHEAIKRFGADLLGREIIDRFEGRFPLLIKLLDATLPLFEQAHPNDGVTRRWKLKDPVGKTEAWYMLRATPDASIFCGQRDDQVSFAELRQALLENRARECMRPRPTVPGDAFLLYAGTMHYSPGGVLFYEIMQNSDVLAHLGPYAADLSAEEKTRRANHVLEAVHLEAGFDCKTTPLSAPMGRSRRGFILACRDFALERLDLVEPVTMDLAGRRFSVLTVIEGQLTVKSAAAPLTLLAGQSVLVPATVPVQLVPEPSAAVLNGYVPDLAADVIAPLRQAGFNNQQIAGLGGRTTLNPLPGLLVP